MRLDLHLDTDPAGRGRRVRWWALLTAWLAVIIAELALIAIIAAAIAAQHL